MLLDPGVYLAAPFIVVAAYTVFGISGFGSALISIPLLAHFLPLRTVVPMMLLLDFSAAVMSGLRYRDDADRREFRVLAPGIVLGAILGVWLLARTPGESLLVPLGLSVAGFGTYNALRTHRPITFGQAWGYPVGFAGGLVAALFGVGGPLYATYLSGRLRDPSQLRATISLVFVLSTSLRIGLFLLTGLLLRPELWLAALSLLPLVYAGIRLGQHVHARVSRTALVRAVSVLLVASGCSLILRGLQQSAGPG